MEDPFLLRFAIRHVCDLNGLLLYDAVAHLSHHFLASALHMLILHKSLTARDQAVFQLQLGTKIRYAVIFRQSLKSGKQLHGAFQLADFGIAQFILIDREIGTTVAVIISLTPQSGNHLHIMLFS